MTRLVLIHIKKLTCFLTSFLKILATVNVLIFIYTLFVAFQNYSPAKPMLGEKTNKKHYVINSIHIEIVTTDWNCS